MARPSLSPHNAPEALFEDISIREAGNRLIAAVEVAPIPPTPVAVIEIVSTNESISPQLLTCSFESILMRIFRQSSDMRFEKVHCSAPAVKTSVVFKMRQERIKNLKNLGLMNK
jgi:hypothetical protein